VYLLRLRQHAGHQGFNRGAVLDRVQAVAAGNLPTDANVAVAVWSRRPGVRLPFLQGRIGIPAETTRGSMRLGVGLAAAFGPALVTNLLGSPLVTLRFPLLAIDFQPVLPKRPPAQDRIFARNSLGWSSHRVLTKICSISRPRSRRSSESIHSRLHHCQDARPNRGGQRRPSDDDTLQIGVEPEMIGGEIAANCAGFCAA